MSKLFVTLFACFLQLALTQDVVRVGSDPVNRSFQDSSGAFSMLADVITDSPVNGMVTAFEIFVKAPNRPVNLIIWRPDGGESFRYVGGVEYTATSAGVKTVPASIPIEVGDVVGLSWRNSGVVAFDVRSCTGHHRYRGTWSAPTYVENQSYVLPMSGANGWGPCRTYSIRAVVTEELPPEECPENTYSSTGTEPDCLPCAPGTESPIGSTECQPIQCPDGAAVEPTVRPYCIDTIGERDFEGRDRVSANLRNTIYLIGEVSVSGGWLAGFDLYTANAEEVTLGFWRLSDDASSARRKTYIYLGGHTLQFDEAGNQSVTYDETPAAERIVVQQGDILGIQWTSGQSVPYVNQDCDDSYDNILRGRSRTIPDVGDTIRLRTPRRPICRQFRAQAIISADE